MVASVANSCDMKLRLFMLQRCRRHTKYCVSTGSPSSLINHKSNSKANKVPGLIKRNCRDLRDVATLRTLYCAFVGSQLEYGSVVWSAFTALMYQSNRSFNIPPPRGKPPPPPAFEFLENFWKIPSSPGRKAVQMPPSPRELPDYCFNFSVA